MNKETDSRPLPDEVEYVKEKREEDSDGEAKTESGEQAPQILEEKKPEGEEIKSLKAKLRKRDAEIKALKKTKERLWDQFVRKTAELDNLRKRFEREKSDYYQYALNDLLLEFLVILDNFERALANKGKEADAPALWEGVELIYRMCLGLLAKQGVKPIEIADKKFDPNLHHAMTAEESDQVTEPVISEELQKGYMIHDRLLRPTLVRVLVPKKS